MLVVVEGDAEDEAINMEESVVVFDVENLLSSTFPSSIGKTDRLTITSSSEEPSLVWILPGLF